MFLRIYVKHIYFSRSNNFNLKTIIIENLYFDCLFVTYILALCEEFYSVKKFHHNFLKIYFFKQNIMQAQLNTPNKKKILLTYIFLLIKGTQFTFHVTFQ